MMAFMLVSICPKVSRILCWSPKFPHMVYTPCITPFLMAQRVKNLPAMKETPVQSPGQEDPLERKWQPISVFLPGEFHGQRSLGGYNLWGHKESVMTEWWTLSLLSIYRNVNRMGYHFHDCATWYRKMDLVDLVVPYLPTLS